MARRSKKTKQSGAVAALSDTLDELTQAESSDLKEPELLEEPEVVVLPAIDQEVSLHAGLEHGLEDTALQSALYPEHLEVEADLAAVEPEQRQIVKYDPLQAYLRDISQYPILSREQERELAVRFKEQGDIDAAYKLVLSNLKLVVMIAREYQRAARSVLDLIQEGNIGLMEAVKNFDPYRNVRFPSYAVWWIKAYMVRFLIANWRLVKIGTTQAQRKLFFNLQKEKDKLEREGFYPAPKLLAQRLDVKESEIVEMEQRLGSPDVSVDAPLNEDDGDASLLTIMPDQRDNVEQTLAKKQMQELLHSALNDFRATLEPREMAIFERRMLAETKATLEEIASEFKLSRERIRQLEVRIETKLKQFLRQRFDGDVSIEDLE